MQDAIQTINDGQLELGLGTNFNIYIGLESPSSTTEFSWIDGTPFDYGNDTSGGVHPWKDAEPNQYTTASNRICVMMDYSQDGNEWQDVTSCTTRRRVLCQDCSGVLNKYIISDTKSQYITDAQTNCNGATTSATSYLASFHSYRDFQELRFLCAAMDGGAQVSLFSVNLYIVSHSISVGISRRLKQISTKFEK